MIGGGLIGVAILLAALGGAIGWAIGLSLIARDGRKVAHWSSAAAGAIGLLAILSGFVLPRNHWAFGYEGGGDGFGILGLMMRGAALCVAAMVAFGIAEVVRARAARHKKSEEEIE